MIGYVLIVLGNVIAYIGVYLTYHASIKKPNGDVFWIVAGLVGTLIGSRLGVRWFK